MYSKRFHNKLPKSLEENLHVQKGKDKLGKTACEEFPKFKVYRCYLNKTWGSQGVSK
jgi:hypothetical protein